MSVKPSRMSGSHQKTLPMSGSVLEARPDICEALPDVREWSGGPTGGLGVIGRPSLMSGSGWEALPNVRE